jgi:hypothetical protein
VGLRVRCEAKPAWHNRLHFLTKDNNTMPDSSNSSESEEPLSSDSLDTMIGLSTETGRTKATTHSSSSEDQALSDPPLTSRESRQPITPCQEGNGRLQNGDLSRSPWQRHLAATKQSTLPLLRPAGQRPLTTQREQHLPTARPRPPTQRWTCS